MKQPFCCSLDGSHVISAVKNCDERKKVKIRGCQILNLYKYSMVGRIYLYIKQIMVVPIVM